MNKTAVLAYISVLFALVLPGLPALALQECSDSCHQIALKIPHELISKGITQIGALDLTSLDAKFAQTRVLFVRNDQGETPTIGSGDALRTSAVFFLKQKTVLVMMQDWLDTPAEVRPVTMLHEHLNAAGIDDENYEVSVALNTINSAPEKDSTKRRATSKLSEPMRDLKRRAVEPRYSLPGPNGEKIRGGGSAREQSGGATGVGGGGDSAVIELKMTLMTVIERFTDLTEASRNKLTTDILYMSIEANPGALGQSFTMAANPSATGMVSFVIDKSIWRMSSPTDRGQIAMNIMGLILQTEHFPELAK